MSGGIANWTMAVSRCLPLWESSLQKMRQVRWVSQSKLHVRPHVLEVEDRVGGLMCLALWLVFGLKGLLFFGRMKMFVIPLRPASTCPVSSLSFLCLQVLMQSSRSLDSEGIHTYLKVCSLRRRYALWGYFHYCRYLQTKIVRNVVSINTCPGIDAVTWIKRRFQPRKGPFGPNLLYRTWWYMNVDNSGEQHIILVWRFSDSLKVP